MGCEFKFMLTLAKMLASEYVSAKLSIYEDNWSSDLISALRETAFRVSQRVLNASSSCLWTTPCCYCLWKDFEDRCFACGRFCIHIRSCREKLLPQYF